MSALRAVQLVPQPVSVEVREGTSVLDPGLCIDASPAWASIARRLLSPGTGIELPVSAGGAFSIVADSSLAPEEYRLHVAADGIRVVASTDRGVNWAVQTLRQLLPPAALRPAPSGTLLELPHVLIEDRPRFGWRGVLLDVARHFQPLADLFRFVDLLALHKYNVAHLHLSDDQGWRFESKRHPRLQGTGGWRTETRRPGDPVGDGTPHGGFYTQDQLRALVSYADQRGVTIMPEIDLPGHALALLAGYPELGNQHEPSYRPATTFGVFDETLNLSDATMDVVLDIYDELLDVFPSRFIHVGGDEAPRSEWLDSPAAQALARQRGLPDASQLQRWFTERLRDWLATRGRQLVGWDEICDDGPLAGAVAMAWRGPEYGVAAAAAGLDVVMSPQSQTYFDHYPGAGADEQYAIGGLTTTQQAYAFDPLEDMSEASRARVLGTQCQVWTEYLPDMRRVEYMLFPRACAHSEVAWSSPVDRSWQEFQPRLAAQLERLDALGVNFRPEAGPHPWQRGGTGVLRRPDAHRLPPG